MEHPRDGREPPDGRSGHSPACPGAGLVSVRPRCGPRRVMGGWLPRPESCPRSHMSDNRAPPDARRPVNLRGRRASSLIPSGRAVGRGHGQSPSVFRFKVWRSHRRDVGSSWLHVASSPRHPVSQRVARGDGVFRAPYRKMGCALSASIFVPKSRNNAKSPSLAGRPRVRGLGVGRGQFIAGSPAAAAGWSIPPSRSQR